MSRSHVCDVICWLRLFLRSAAEVIARGAQGPGVPIGGVCMAQDWARAFYASGAWVRCRESFAAMRRAADGGVCQDCGRSLGEIAHHWPVPLTAENIGDPAVAPNHDNLRVQGVSRSVPGARRFQAGGAAVGVRRQRGRDRCRRGGGAPLFAAQRGRRPDRSRSFGEYAGGREAPLGGGKTGKIKF